MKRTVTLLILAACAAACSSNDEPKAAPGSASPSATASASAPPSSSAAPSSPSVAPNASGSAKPTGNECANKDLRVEAGDSQGAAGTIYTRFVVTNKGTAACTLYGHPDVRPYKGNPPARVEGVKTARIAADDANFGGTPPATTLAPGTGTAVFFVVYGTAPVGDAACRKADGLLFTAPPRTTWAAAPAAEFELTSCGSPVEVSAIYPPSKTM
ncbi:DUF4232 domain-containing protein [Actinocorallia longicatena]|uniref:DUF4232 domain-containing protein n=1 Tax=Actinocorallia longicatena TaxID=111803 RepID=A0ABP6Q2G9_9ACTN